MKSKYKKDDFVVYNKEFNTVARVIRVLKEKDNFYYYCKSEGINLLLAEKQILSKLGESNE